MVFKINNQQAGCLDITNTSFGYSSLAQGISGTRNAAFGLNALSTNTLGFQNSAFGTGVLSQNNGSNNTGIGQNTLTDNTTGSNNSAVGSNALYYTTTGSNNTSVGYNAMNNNNTGSGNIAVGDSALDNNLTGNYNMALGHYADVMSGNLTNATAIGYYAKVGESNAIVLGDTGARQVNVGIGTGYPAANLDVEGSVKLKAGTPGAGKVLTSDVNGNATWQTPTGGGGNGWNLTGNTGTTPGTDFIGTIDNADLVVKVNNTASGLLNISNSNSSWGFHSLTSNTSGNNNTATGAQSLNANTTGHGNTANGAAALQYNTTGIFNTASGWQALYDNSTGSSNTAVGESVLFSNSSGSGNTAIGDEAMYNNSTGQGNTASGGLALSDNTTGSYNSVYGNDASLHNISGSNNTSFGTEAMFYNTTGNSNVAMGINALFNNVSGSNLVAVGDSALYSQNGGTGQNTAVGSKALLSNTTGASNSANGFLALGANTTGSNNTATGWGALGNNKTAGNNTAHGAYALVNNISGFNNTAFGAAAVANSTTGNSNVGVGYASLITNTTGSGNTAIGDSADVLSVNLINSTAIGYNAKVGASNSMVLGGTGAYAINVGIGTTTPARTLSVKTVTNSLGISHTDGTIELATYVGGAITGGYFGTVSNHPFAIMTNNSGAQLYVQNGTGNVGIGTSAPYSQLCNTSTYINGNDGSGVASNGLTWLASVPGFTMATYNSSTASNAQGLVVKIAGTAAGNRILDLATAPTQTSVGTSVMVVQGDGNVGIGAAGPNSKLAVTTDPAHGHLGGAAISSTFTTYAGTLPSVSGASVKLASFGFGSTNETSLGIKAYRTGAGSSWSTTAIGLQMDVDATEAAGGASIWLASSGFIGIGTQHPAAPLDVQQIYSTYNEGAYGYLIPNGNTGTATNTSASVSIRATGKILAPEFDALSDRRIKTNIAPVSTVSALSLARNLEVVHYNYIDKMSKGLATKTGFIAQQVETALPDAINRTSDFIPSVYAPALKLNETGSRLTVTTLQPHNFVQGDIIKLYDKANKSYEVRVSAVSAATAFEISDWDGPSDSLFIYGKRINDLRSVDFDQITAVSIGAVQELDKKVAELEKRNAALENENSKLNEKMNAISSASGELSDLKMQLSELRILMEKNGIRTQK